jgi:hypothetical protein
MKVRFIRSYAFSLVLIGRRVVSLEVVAGKTLYTTTINGLQCTMNFGVGEWVELLVGCGLFHKQNTPISAVIFLRKLLAWHLGVQSI